MIAGAGLTGLSAALQLAERGSGRPIVLLEREQRVGGKARSERSSGYTFDVTGHWLHLRDDRVRALVRRVFEPGDLVEIERKTGIYTHGVMLPYPFQANLHGLPLPIVQRCLVEFVAAQRAATRPDAPTPRTFEDFAIARFGRGIAEEFFIPYNAKLWGEHYAALTPAWVSRFVPLPDVAQVIGGALGLRQDGLGYNARFLYPERGGIDALPEALLAAVRASEAVELRLGVGVRAIDTARRRLALDDGSTLDYARLVSTLPLPVLVDAIVDAPAGIRADRSALRAVRWRYLDVATRRAPPIAEHWVYVPDPTIPFFRVGVYSNAIPAMAPPGHGALYVELTDRTGPPDLPHVFRCLTEMGALHDPGDVVFAHVRDIEYAYVVYDEAHARVTPRLHAWLGERAIRSSGRYGAWIYNSMEDSILDGMEAATWASA